MRILIIFILLQIPAKLFAQDLAVMMFIDEVSHGDIIYTQHLKQFGFKRFYVYQGNNSDYHLSLGYIDDVHDYELEEFKKYLTAELVKILPTNLEFEFGAATMLGKGIPYIVAIPHDVKEFLDLNKQLNEILARYKHHKYKLKKISRPENYIPHLTLNGKLHKEIKLDQLSATLKALDINMKGVKFNLNKLVIN
jgi:hypothetical protein